MLFIKTLSKSQCLSVEIRARFKMDVNIKNPFLEFLPNSVVNIRNNYNLDNNRIVQAVDILEDWMKKQKHFRNKKFDRRYLELAIISCKGSVEKAKKQIDKLCTFRTLLPKFFISSGVRSICHALNEHAHVVVLPKLTKDHQRVFVLKINEKEFTSARYLDYYRLSFVLAEYLKAHDYVDGFIIIDDFRDVNLVDLVTKINLIEFQQFMSILTEGYGARLKGIHVISQSKMIDMFIRTIKPVISQKIADRIHIHPEIEDLHKIIDKRILPVDLGGEERPIKEIQDEWTDLLSSKEHEKYLEVMRASSTDESQRQTDKFNEQYMGLPGSFTTLTVD